MAPEDSPEKLLKTYLGASFAVFLALLPKSSITHLPNLLSRNRSLSLKLLQAEDQIRQMRCRRQEDAKANARVVEIFASHRHAWQQEESRLLSQIDAMNEEIEEMRRREKTGRDEVERLRREVAERDEVIGFMGRRTEDGGGNDEKEVEIEPVPEACFYEDVAAGRPELFSAWPERWSSYQDYPAKTYMARRVDGESAGITAKLKRLERELADMEQVNNGEATTTAPALRKQAKRYVSLAGKIDELCRKMTAGDGRTAQRQTEFLVEVFHLQERAGETRQKLAATAAATSAARGAERKAADTVRASFREIQRSLEVWLARIMGDLEGVLARNGVSSVKEYCLSRYPVGPVV